MAQLANLVLYDEILQELQMLSSFTLNYQITMIVMKSGLQLPELSKSSHIWFSQ